MTTLTVPPPTVPRILTQTLDEFVEQQVVEEGCADESEYFAKLAEAERQRKITAYYEREIQRGLDSGPPIPLTPEFWDKLDAEIERAYHERRKEKSA